MGDICTKDGETVLAGADAEEKSELADMDDATLLDEESRVGEGVKDSSSLLIIVLDGASVTNGVSEVKVINSDMGTEAEAMPDGVVTDKAVEVAEGKSEART